MDHQPQVNSIILGAGTSKRMGETKQLLKLQHKALLHHVIDQVLQINFVHINTVIGHDGRGIQQAIRMTDHRFNWVWNHHYQEGQSTSLKAGLQCFLEDQPHVMVFLGDMPFIRQSTIRCILNYGLATAKVIQEPFTVRPVYKEKIGHPVFFGHIHSRFFDELNGDVGAKGMIRNMKHEKMLDVNDEGVIWDIDTVQAYEAAKKHVLT